MELPYRSETVDEAGRHFDEVAGKIRRKEFRVLEPPEKKICKECDMKTFCQADGLIGNPGPAERVVASGALRDT